MLSAILPYNYLGSVNPFDNAGIFADNRNAGVNAGFIFHTCADDRILSHQQRNCLALHIRAHQSTVSVVVFKEGYHSGCDGYYHLGRNIHKVDILTVNFHDLVAISAVYLCSCELIILSQRLVRLSYHVVILDVSGHVNDLVGDNAGCLINPSVRGFDEAVFVDLCV